MPHDVTVNVSIRSTQDGSTIEDSLVESFTRTVASKEVASATVPAAKAGSLTTRTDADTGVVTFDAGHGFVTSDLVDLFWSGGSRRGMTATVSGDDVTLDGGSGDDLPVQDTAVTGMVPHEVAAVIDGDEVVGISASSPRPGYVAFFEDNTGDVLITAYEMSGSNSRVWSADLGSTNPLAGKITNKVKFSHDDANSERVMKAVVYFNEEE